jgi:hypothetical protein
MSQLKSETLCLGVADKGNPVRGGTQGGAKVDGVSAPVAAARWEQSLDLWRSIDSGKNIGQKCCLRLEQSATAFSPLGPRGTIGGP